MGTIASSLEDVACTDIDRMRLVDRANQHYRDTIEWLISEFGSCYAFFDSHATLPSAQRILCCMYRTVTYHRKADLPSLQ